MAEHMPVCPACGRAAQMAQAAFCPFCGAPMAQNAGASDTPEGAAKLLLKAEKMNDPVKKYKLLLQAREEYPNCLAVEEEILFLGRLHERNPKKLDFSIIKCFLWHMYLTPGEFSDEKKQEMRAELFEHPQLEVCRSLAPDAQRYTEKYLYRLACEFVALFLKGSNQYTRSMFGFRLDNRMSRVLAEPVARMLENIHGDEQLPQERRWMLYHTLYRAFLTETGSEPRWVDEQLQKLELPIPAKS